MIGNGNKNGKGHDRKGHVRLKKKQKGNQIEKQVQVNQAKLI